MGSSALIGERPETHPFSGLGERPETHPFSGLGAGAEATKATKKAEAIVQANFILRGCYRELSR